MPVTYERLGVRPLINATCHWTAYGGTVMWPEVVEAMASARVTNVDVRDLLDRAGEFISRYTHAEASHVVSGCAAGLMVGAAAIMTGEDPIKMQQLPHTHGVMKNEFVSLRFGTRRDATGREYTHHGYAHAVRGAGGVFVEIGGPGGTTRAELESALGPNTAGVYWYSDGESPGLQLDEVIQLAHAHGIPVLIDASNTLPPPEHLYEFIDLGADLVAFSGGKGLRGPQGSGILTGRADLIRAARLQSAPIQGIGRPLKVSKEEIVGLLTALEIWAARDHDADLRDAKRRTQRVVDALADLPGVRLEHKFPDFSGRPYPTVVLHLDPSGEPTGEKVVAAMLAGTPSVAIMPHSDHIVRVDVRILTDEQVEQVIARFREVLAAPTSLAAGRGGYVPA